MTPPPWLLLHPQMTPEHLGFLPGFLDEEDKRPAKEQFDDRYVGGWMAFGGDKFKLLDRWRLKYPGNPVLVPRAIARLRKELIVFYDHDVVAIIQPDRTFEVARMD
jgi:hypothetical protein